MKQETPENRAVFYYAKAASGVVIDAAFEEDVSKAINENRGLLSGEADPRPDLVISARDLFGSGKRPILPKA